MQIMEKWRRDSALLRFDQAMVLCIGWGAAFNLNNWLILCAFSNASYNLLPLLVI